MLESTDATLTSAMRRRAFVTGVTSFLVIRRARVAKSVRRLAAVAEAGSDARQDGGNSDESDEQTSLHNFLLLVVGRERNGVFSGRRRSRRQRSTEQRKRSRERSGREPSLFPPLPGRNRSDGRR